MKRLQTPHAKKSGLDLSKVIDCIDLLLKEGSDETLKGEVSLFLNPFDPFSIADSIIVNPVEYLLLYINKNVESENAKKLLELFIPYSQDAANYFGKPFNAIPQCPICFEKRATRVTICKHEFCNYCLTKWLKKNNSCPICRGKIN